MSILCIAFCVYDRKLNCILKSNDSIQLQTMCAEFASFPSSLCTIFRLSVEVHSHHMWPKQNAVLFIVSTVVNLNLELKPMQRRQFNAMTAIFRVVWVSLALHFDLGPRQKWAIFPRKCTETTVENSKFE